MNNKLLSLILICLLVGVLSMGFVCAKSMKTEDFGTFKMDVPKDSNFVKQEIEDSDDNVFDNQEQYVDEKNLIILTYVDTPLFSGEHNAIIYQALFEAINVDLNQSYEYQEGDLRIIEPVHKSNEVLSLVGLTSGNETLILLGPDTNLIKDMAHTTEF